MPETWTTVSSRATAGDQRQAATPFAVDESASWSERYDVLGLQNLSSQARKIVHDDAQYIVDHGVRPSIDASAWPSSRVRTGIVIGAIQSGKTASMLAVSARLLDRGTDIIVLLAGTRIALWRQTYERMLTQLDGTTSETSRARRRERLIIPRAALVFDASVRSNAETYLNANRRAFTNSLRRRRPVIFVIPKIESHLHALACYLEELLAPVARERSFEMVVLDDEADDGSVLDAENTKVLPRRIEMLWTGRRTGPQTMAPQLFATYVAYTATPQANFLQEDHNPLAPRSFCAALRVPYKEGRMRPRTPTFSEPEGLGRFYCGGEMFYVELAGQPTSLVRALPFPAPDGLVEAEHRARVRTAADRLLKEGLRSFLVSAALSLRHSCNRGKLLYSESMQPLVSDQLSKLLPPHTMLIHPAARIDTHAEEARRLVLLAHGLDPDDDDVDDPEVGGNSARKLDKDAIRQQIEADPQSWRTWIEQFEGARRGLELLPGAEALPSIEDAEWDWIVELLVEEVVPYVEIRVINSDPDSDDSPRFTPQPNGDGTFSRPRDLLTIFVSGNVMSRGITLEGLHTSVFTRPASEPAADTQMQMQRWFGYRGAYIHMARLFCFADQLALFRSYHEHDTALRKEVLAVMDHGDDRSPITVLTGSRSLATAKVKTSRLPLHPGPSPFVRLLEVGKFAASNAKLLNDVLGRGSWTDVMLRSGPIGRIREQAADLQEIAALLDSLRYTHHDPDPNESARYTRWRSLERQLRIEEPLFRPPGSHPGPPRVDVKRCPYSIAAYLRLWDAALRRPRCDGLFATHADEQPWAMVQPTLKPPRFYIGVRYGSALRNSWENQGLLTQIRAMRRGVTREEDGAYFLDATWGTRGGAGENLGDQRFDYHYHKTTPPPLLDDRALWRPVDHPGLLLFQVISIEGEAADAITVGLALPHGGPEQFAAIAT